MTMYVDDKVNGRFYGDFYRLLLTKDILSWWKQLNELRTERKRRLLCGLHKECKYHDYFDVPCTIIIPCFFIPYDESKREYYEPEKPKEREE